MATRTTHGALRRTLLARQQLLRALRQRIDATRARIRRAEKGGAR